MSQKNSRPAEGKAATVAVALVLLGMLGAVAVFVALAVSDFTWVQLAYYLPALGVSALLVFVGARRLKRK